MKVLSHRRHADVSDQECSRTVDDGKRAFSAIAIDINLKALALQGGLRGGSARPGWI